MLGRKMYPLAAALGLWAGGDVTADPQGTPAAKPAAAAPAKVVDNQKQADMVAAKLKASGVVKGAKVGIETRGGTVVLTGTVTSQKQHEDILREVTKVDGITRIESEIQAPLPAPVVVPASGKSGKHPAAPAMAPAPVMAPAELPASVPAARQMPAKAPDAAGTIIRTGGQGEPVFAPPGGPAALPYPAPGAAAVSQDPVPLNGQPAYAPLDPTGPRLPPNAWPTYAPYNNMSRVAYPAAYPYNAFPYIGPFYPFPKVPLGWRKVVLEWDDGHWYMGRLQSPHDHWRVKFW